jgi:hypothetical protein
VKYQYAHGQYHPNFNIVMVYKGGGIYDAITILPPARKSPMNALPAVIREYAPDYYVWVAECFTRPLRFTSRLQ